MDLLVREDVVRRDAGLPGVRELPPADTLGRHLEVRRAIHDRRALSAELQGDRGEVLRGRRHHDPADRPVARVEDVIEPLREELGRLCDASLDHADRVAVDVPGELGRDERAGRGRDLGGLHDDGVAGGDRADQRTDQQAEGVVPRRDDQHHAERLAVDEALARLEDERRRDLRRLHPPRERPLRVRHLGRAVGDLRRIPFEPRLPHVRSERREDRVLPFSQEAGDPVELREPPAGRARDAGVEGASGGLDGGRDHGERGGGRQGGCCGTNLGHRHGSKVVRKHADVNGARAPEARSGRPASGGSKPGR
jgi:hypothetical protein